jgi:exonuclease SbcC
LLSDWKMVCPARCAAAAIILNLRTGQVMRAYWRKHGERRSPLPSLQRKRSRGAIAGQLGEATLDERQATLSGLDVPQRGVSEIETEYRHFLAAINELGSIVDLTLLAKEVDDLRDRKLATATKLQQANSTLGDATTAEALSRQGYADRIASVPEALRDATVLQAAIDAARADLNRRKKAISDALEHEQSSQAALIKAEAALQNASTSLNDCADEVERSRLHLTRD